ncbi:MAG: 1-(5-phosphoribosyl)-5-[(5-phosphoribosylamino)methylideneamino]imidazole-4-carboxamide isomerase [Actinobacteria bacterium]|nr:1-(5-phosphoribosyl)-5-[(5-phosphoribosylamino)methylideneamino]imidazole-4-carboxamide isomerase [Actinomycetota bacterium]
MIIYPAIDIINGECVRLVRGDYSQKKKYSSDPVKVAIEWKKCGAEWLHVVDLDGAKTGELKNLDTAADIKKKTGLKIQYGGGIRDIASAGKVLNAGIDRIILGTGVLEDAGFLKNVFNTYKKRFILSLDFDSSGKLYKHGWQSETSFNIFDYLSEINIDAIKEVIITSISKDGTLNGPDTGIIEKILKISRFKLIIAGGISKIEDIIKLKSIEKYGISGAIIGKALYEGRLDLREAIMIAEGNLDDFKKDNTMP